MDMGCCYSEFHALCDRQTTGLNIHICLCMWGFKVYFYAHVHLCAFICMFVYVFITECIIRKYVHAGVYDFK